MSEFRWLLVGLALVAVPACALDRSGVAVDVRLDGGRVLAPDSSSPPPDGGTDGGAVIPVDDAGPPDGGPVCLPDQCAGRLCDGDRCGFAVSCADLHARRADLESGVYALQPAGAAASFPAYCEMAADGGGWTLLLKIDGDETTFAFDSARWTDDSVYAPDEPSLDDEEAKLAGFASMPFSALRVGLTSEIESPSGGGQAVTLSSIRWAVINVSAASLRALFMGNTIATGLGRDAWIGLLDGGRLQPNCNREGINVRGDDGNILAARIGILANNENHCASNDSMIGLGIRHYADDITAGSISRHPQVDLPSFGYLMVR